MRLVYRHDCEELSCLVFDMGAQLTVGSTIPLVGGPGMQKGTSWTRASEQVTKQCSSKVCTLEFLPWLFPMMDKDLEV